MIEIFTPFLSPDQIKTSPEDRAYYGRDWLKDYTPAPSLILFPKSTEDVAAIVRSCRTHRLSIVPSGGRTGLSGGATATKGEIIVSLEKMNRIVKVDPVARNLTAEAGVITETIQRAAEDLGFYFPVEFTTKGSSMIGGNIATNAGGIRVIKYGNIRSWILGLTVVTGSGEILHLNGELIKNNTGYDLRHLFIGSEGTLGIITEACLALSQKPHDRVRILCGCAGTEQVLAAFHTLRMSGLEMSAFEYFSDKGLQKVLAHHPLPSPFTASYPAYFLLELEITPHEPRENIESVLGALLEEETILDAVISASPKQSDDLLALRERIGETLSSHYYPHKNDISVPIASIPQFLSELEALLKVAYPSYEIVVFGHIGDGNLHVNIVKPSSLSREEFLTSCHEVDHKIFTLVQQYRGSISAEHGVGLLKKEFLTYSRSTEEISLMRGIKKVFDPDGILNPGKIFDGYQ